MFVMRPDGVKGHEGLVRVLLSVTLGKKVPRLLMASAGLELGPSAVDQQILRAQLPVNVLVAKKELPAE